MSKINRRTLLSSASLAVIAASPPLEVLAALPGNPSAEASSKAFDNLAEAKRLIAALIASDEQISAAEDANDKKRHRALERRNRTLYREFRDFADRVQEEPPTTWLDIVVRAEIAGYSIAWDRPRTDWDDMLAEAEDDGTCYDGVNELAMAVLYLAERRGRVLSVVQSS